MAIVISKAVIRTSGLQPSFRNPGPASEAYTKLMKLVSDRQMKPCLFSMLASVVTGHHMSFRWMVVNVMHPNMPGVGSDTERKREYNYTIICLVVAVIFPVGRTRRCALIERLNFAPPAYTKVIRTNGNVAQNYTLLAPFNGPNQEKLATTPPCNW